jgi:hypothetical protein
MTDTELLYKTALRYKQHFSEWERQFMKTLKGYGQELSAKITQKQLSIFGRFIKEIRKLMTKEEFIKTEQDFIIKVFDTEHEILPQFTILRSTGKIEKFVAFNDFPNRTAKDIFHAQMKKICKQPNVVACIKTVEVWLSCSESSAMNVRPSLDPNRKSAVVFTYFTKNEIETIIFLDNNGKLELSENFKDGDFKWLHYGNPFDLINLKNTKYN